MRSLLRHLKLIVKCLWNGIIFSFDRMQRLKVLFSTMQYYASKSLSNVLLAVFVNYFSIHSKRNTYLGPNVNQVIYQSG